LAFFSSRFQEMTMRVSTPFLPINNPTVPSLFFYAHFHPALSSSLQSFTHHRTHKAETTPPFSVKDFRAFQPWRSKENSIAPPVDYLSGSPLSYPPTIRPFLTYFASCLDGLTLAAGQIFYCTFPLRPPLSFHRDSQCISHIERTFSNRRAFPSSLQANIHPSSVADGPAFTICSVLPA